eukprot:4391381-Karenia_brevis.AAC.1
MTWLLLLFSPKLVFECWVGPSTPDISPYGAARSALLLGLLDGPKGGTLSLDAPDVPIGVGEHGERRGAPTADVPPK